ncbi:MAG: hypothetical protein WBA25_18885 [Jannaschia sp.]
MHSDAIRVVIDAVEPKFGPIRYFAKSEDEEHGICFLVRGIPATFSVITLEGTLPPGIYSVQIEGQPPGDHIYIRDRCGLDELVELMARYRVPIDLWPS